MRSFVVAEGAFSLGDNSGLKTLFFGRLPPNL
jgi:hypothetical protein